MCIVHQSVKDGVAQGGVADDFVPLRDGELAGDQGGPQVVAVLQDLEDIATLLLGQTGQAPVVDDEQVDPRIGGKDSTIPAVGFGQGQVVEEPGRAKVEGAQGLVHRSRGRPSNRRIDAGTHAAAVAFMKGEDFHDYGPTLLSETFAEEKGIAVSRETMRQWMAAEGCWKPRKAKVQHRQWRERKACCGEMVQMDTSIHEWFEGRGEEAVLIAIIDDAKSELFCRFCRGDSTASNMSVLREYIRRHGRPRSLYVDKASHFMTSRPPTPGEQRTGKGAQTQIQRALEELHIKHITAHSPQAKGRVERCFATLQDRLVKGLRRAKIATIEEANAYLEKVFIPLWRRRFIQAPREAANAHRSRKGYDLNAIFSHQETRCVTDDYTFSYRGVRYQIEKRSIAAGLRRSNVTIEERLDGTRKIRWRGRYLRCHPVASQAATPKATRPDKSRIGSNTPANRKPARNHPWRRGCTLMQAEVKP